MTAASSTSAPMTSTAAECRAADAWSSRDLAVLRLDEPGLVELPYVNSVPGRGWIGTNLTLARRLRATSSGDPLEDVSPRPSATSNMPMNVFQLMKQVLDEEYRAIPGSDAGRDATVKTRLADLSAAYKRLASSPPKLDYGDPATRLAYVFRYVTSHTHLVAEELSECDEVRELLEADRLAVSCLGGGPGSDLLGLLKHLVGTGWEGALQVYLLDREAGWGDAWSDVGGRLEDLDFTVFSHFQQLDVTDLSTWTKQRKYLRANLFTFIYFVSEISALGAKAEPFFDHLFANADPGALFLFIDNIDTNAGTFVSWFDRVARRNGLELLHARKRDARLPGREQKADLEPYPTKFDGQPKLTAKVECRVYRKPAP